MTTIGNTYASTNAPAATKPAGSMDQNDFLRLMTTQLTTQDPFNPVDNTQMVAQMAQFSQVAGIAEMNQSLKALVEGMAPGRLTDASSWIGRSILVESDIAAPRTDGSYGGEIALEKDADQVTLSLVDENGAVMHSQDLGARDAGTVSFSWDGKGPDGQAVPGPLKIVVNARSGGDVVETASASWTNVAGIQSPASGSATKLLTSLGLVSPDAAIRLV
jgi:flagellar basal-body rod modification protein FlgD